MITRYARTFFKQVTVGKDRFRTNDKPTQQNFDKLFDSIGLIKEAADAAKDNEQGFVRTASDADVIAFQTYADGFVRAVQPHQLALLGVLGVDETWKTVGGGGNMDNGQPVPGFETGWAADPFFDTLAIRKTRTGKLALRGGIFTAAGVGPGSILLTLPTGYTLTAGKFTHIDAYAELADVYVPCYVTNAGTQIYLFSGSFAPGISEVLRFPEMELSLD